MAKQILTQDYIKNSFEYKNGNLYRKNHKYNALNGKKAGVCNTHGYLQVRVKNKLCLVHRLIFLMHYGYLPHRVDHIDNNKTNNFIENLRAATPSENAQNSKIRKSNKSGYKGVSWHKLSKKWVVQIMIDKKVKTVGRFNDIELADLVAQEARDKYHKEFARHF